MKKLLVIALSLMMVFAFTACGTPSSSDSSSKADISNSSNDKTDPDSQKDSGDKKSLVVYYSATGNTKKAAEYIASATGGDLFELVPKQPYSDDDLDWRNEDSRVMLEHDNLEKRNIELEKSTVDNWEDYDTVYIGYPIWWGIAAWPVNGFIEANDFTGKTVVPFCTSASSGLGESGELLKEAAGSGNWLEGMRFDSDVSESDVSEWVKTIK